MAAADEKRALATELQSLRDYCTSLWLKGGHAAAAAGVEHVLGGSSGGGGGAALVYESFSALVSKMVTAQGRQPLSTLEQLGLFANCDLDGSQDIDFNEWCGALPRLAALLEKRQDASVAAHARWATATATVPSVATAAAAASSEELPAGKGGAGSAKAKEGCFVET